MKSIAVVLGQHGIVDGKVDPQIRSESIVLLRESELLTHVKNDEEEEVV